MVILISTLMEEVHQAFSILNARNTGTDQTVPRRKLDRLSFIRYDTNSFWHNVAQIKMAW